MKLLLATGNAHKLEEFKRILSPLGVEIISPADVGLRDWDIEETGATFKENARIKAENLYNIASIPTIADDSGICADALGGRPGVFSARYKAGLTQEEKNLALLDEMKDVAPQNRTARFVCSIFCVIDDENKIEADGVCEGTIAFEPSGGGGFGYDPIFTVSSGKSFAGLSDAEKDEISHRGVALRIFAEKLHAYFERGNIM